METMHRFPSSSRLLAALSVAALLAPFGSSGAQQAGHRLYFVPGARVETTARTTFSLAAFLDGRNGIIGRGHLAIIEGGRDAVKAHIGIADVSSSRLGYSVQLSGLRTQKAPFNAVPNSTYAGSELHLFVTVINIGVGYYAPVGRISGRKGMATMSLGVGF
jgi:hypothetical protein